MNGVKEKNVTKEETQEGGKKCYGLTEGGIL